jgi:hypothetical protein
VARRFVVPGVIRALTRREVFDLLDVRLAILDEHTSSTPMRIRVEGVVANLERIVPNVVS